MHVWPTVSRSVLRDFDPVYVANVKVFVRRPPRCMSHHRHGGRHPKTFTLVDHLLALSSPLR